MMTSEYGNAHARYPHMRVRKPLQRKWEAGYFRLRRNASAERAAMVPSLTAVVIWR